MHPPSAATASTEAATPLPGDIPSALPSTAATGAYVWYVIGLLSLTNVFNYMDRTALSVLMPAIKADFHLSDTQLGLLTGVSFALFYAVCGIPIARWADRGVRRDIIALAIAAWSIMTALSGAAQNFLHLLLARIGVGAGEAGGMAPAQSIICDYVPVQRRPGAFGIHNTGLAVGLFAGLALAGWLSDTVGWRWAFVLLGLPGLLLALVIRLTLREPVRGALDTPRPATAADSVPMPLGRTIAILWNCRTYRFLIAWSGMNGFVEFGLSQWWPSFYTRTMGLSMSFVGVNLGLANGLGLGAGLICGGLLANKLAQRNVRFPLLIGAACYLTAMPLFLASLFVSSGQVSMLLVAVARFFQAMTSGPIFATLFSVTAPQRRATAGAMNTFFQSALGYGFGPLCVGLLSDRLTPTLGSEALRYALLAPVCLIPLIAAAVYMASRFVAADLRAAGASMEAHTSGH